MPRASSDGAHVLVVVDLAVVDDDIAAVGRDHRLMAGRRQVDDRKPAVRERNAGLRVNPHACVVRSAVVQTAVHRTGNLAKLLAGPPRPACNKARDAAHNRIQCRRRLCIAVRLEISNPAPANAKTPARCSPASRFLGFAAISGRNSVRCCPGAARRARADRSAAAAQCGPPNRKSKKPPLAVAAAAAAIRADRHAHRLGRSVRPPLDGDVGDLALAALEDRDHPGVAAVDVLAELQLAVVVDEGGLVGQVDRDVASGS